MKIDIIQDNVRGIFMLYKRNSFGVCTLLCYANSLAAAEDKATILLKDGEQTLVKTLGS